MTTGTVDAARRAFVVSVGFGVLGGLVFTVLGTDDLPRPWPLTGVLVAAVAVAALVCGTTRRWQAASARPPTGLSTEPDAEPEAEPDDGAAVFGRGYGFALAVSVVVLVAGLVVLSRVLRAGEFRTPWIAFVVGAHLVVLAVVWRARTVRLPGLALTAFGVLGALAAVLTGAPAVASAVAGIGAGIAMFANTYLLVRRALPR